MCLRRPRAVAIIARWFDRLRRGAVPAELHGRIALVTGASSGLGAAAARALAEGGATVAVAARRRDRLVALAEEIGGLAVDCDLLDVAGMDEVVGRVARDVGGPEILVNAAGTFEGACPAEDEPLAS